MLDGTQRKNTHAYMLVMRKNTHALAKKKALAQQDTHAHAAQGNIKIL